jgi:transposase-like protein
MSPTLIAIDAVLEHLRRVKQREATAAAPRAPLAPPQGCPSCGSTYFTETRDNSSGTRWFKCKACRRVSPGVP